MTALRQYSNIQTYVYANAEHAFARPEGQHYQKSSALIAHERSISALRKAVGPDYDLEALWEEHVSNLMPVMLKPPWQPWLPNPMSIISRL